MAKRIAGVSGNLSCGTAVGSRALCVDEMIIKAEYPKSLMRSLCCALGRDGGFSVLDIRRLPARDAKSLPVFDCGLLLLLHILERPRDSGP